MNKLLAAKRVQILSMLCEGTSMRSAARLADVSINTVSKHLVDAGLVCAAFDDETVRGVKSRRVQADEIWSFVGAKEKRATADQKAAGWGDIWTWTAIDADSKLLVSFLVGDRGPHNCYEFMKDVASRLANKIQLTTDGLTWYVDAVDNAFGIDIRLRDDSEALRWRHRWRAHGCSALQPCEIHQRDQGGDKGQPGQSTHLD